MMFRATTHARGLYAGSVGGTSYSFRVPVAVGERVKNLRVWLTVYSRPSSNTITVSVNHSDELQAVSFFTHTSDVVSSSSSGSTGKFTGVIDIATKGMLGSYVEVVLTISGAVSNNDLQVTIEGNPF